MHWFVTRFHGWIIRIGPETLKYGEPYRWSIPLSENGEFVGVSTEKLTSSAVKTAIEAAHALGFKEPFWSRNRQGVFIMTAPLHAKHGATLGAQTDQSKVAEVVMAYLEKIKDGTMHVEHIGEIDLGGGKWIRTFVIDEGSH